MDIFEINHSSKSEQTTRVKSGRKQAKKTVGITLPRQLLAETREHKLNMSKITEQALNSILEYLAQQNKTESSINFLNRRSFPKDISQRKNRGK
jgi:post-segregation antitoxin (ccd killing protein)